MKRAGVVLAALLVLSACGGGDELDSSDIAGGWQLESGAADGTPLELVDSHPVTIEFIDDRYGGTAACNHYGGTYSMSARTIEFGQSDITEMACEPVATMELEQRYMTALSMVDTIRIEGGGQLELTGTGTELVFSRFAPPETENLLGTVWILEGLVEGETVTSVSGDRATLEFFSDGSFIGSTGCRNLTGTYTQTATGIATTEMFANGECPTDLTRQDSQVVTVLEGSYRLAIEADQLTLTISGDEGLNYRSGK